MSLNMGRSDDEDLALLREAIQIAADPSARLALTDRVRKARPATMRDLLLHGLVRYIQFRREHAERIDAATGSHHTWAQMFPELPITVDDAMLMAGPELAGVVG